MLDCSQLYPAQISGGQRQRIAIAQQLLCSEHFLLMDEPFSGLDLVMEAKVCELINEIACLDELNPIIVVTHDVTAAATVADHLWLMGRDRGASGNIIPGAHPGDLRPDRTRPVLAPGHHQLFQIFGICPRSERKVPDAIADWARESHLGSLACGNHHQKEKQERIVR
jgi:ABC-type nitrate/sulfonate/bicarbonate transport system ATPase subunit